MMQLQLKTLVVEGQALLKPLSWRLFPATPLFAKDLELSRNPGGI